VPARPYRDLLLKLREQVGFLVRSCEAFDSGAREEGHRLAVVIRVLVHDTKQSRSLLGQLGIKEKLRFTDTALHHSAKPRHLGGNRYVVTSAVHAGLVGWEGGPHGWRFFPLLDDLSEERQNPPLPFGDWWFKVFLRDTKRNALTRKHVTLDVANKQGGAHVAETITNVLRDITSGESLPFRTGVESEQGSPIAGIDLVTMRQIAHEMHDTLRREVPSFLREPPLGSGVRFTAIERSAIPAGAECLCGSGVPFRECHEDDPASG
jgi:hypothetical protein